MIIAYPVIIMIAGWSINVRAAQLAAALTSYHLAFNELNIAS
jgi:hypothetical protein